MPDSSAHLSAHYLMHFKQWLLPPSLTEEKSDKKYIIWGETLKSPHFGEIYGQD